MVDVLYRVHGKPAYFRGTVRRRHAAGQVLVVRGCGFLHAARGGVFAFLCAVRVGLRPFWRVCARPKVFLFAAAVGAPTGIGRRT